MPQGVTHTPKDVSSKIKNKELLIYSRERAGQEIVVMLNLSNKDIKYTSNDAIGRGSYTDYFAGVNVPELPQSLKAWEYKVFVRPK